MPWELTGNAGTDPQNDYLGTTDGQPLVIGTNGQESVRDRILGRAFIILCPPAASWIRQNLTNDSALG